MPYEIIVSSALRPVATGTITVGATATGIPNDAFNQAQGRHLEILLGVEGDQIRLSPTATAASATDMLFEVGDKIRLAGSAICRQLTMIRVTGDATVRYWVFVG